jgi:hypothetical protein
MDPIGPYEDSTYLDPEMNTLPAPLVERRKKPARRFSRVDFIHRGMIVNTFEERLAWLFCAIALIANITALISHFAIDFLVDTPSAITAALLWVSSVILAGSSAILFTIKIQKLNRGKSKWYFWYKRLPQILWRVWFSVKAFFSKLTFWSLPNILFLAFLVRIIPILKNGLYLDEWYWLESAKRILAGSLSSPFGFIGDQPANLPAFPIAVMLALFNHPMLAVRITGVIYSLITIIFLYLLIENMIGKKAAVIGSMLLSISVWDIHMSNLGWNNVNVNPMLVSGILYFLYKIYTNKYTIWTLFAFAFFLAVCLHLLYVAALLIIPVLFSFLVLAVIWIKHNSGPQLRVFILFGIYFVICLSPLLPKLVKYPEASIGRHYNFVQENINLSKESNSPIRYYYQQALLLGEDFSTGAGNFRQTGLWGITLDPVVQFLAGLGILLVCIAVIRKKATSFWVTVIVCLGALLLIPFIILFRTTSVWRAYAILPIVYLLAVYSIVQISNLEKIITLRYLFKTKGLTIFFLTLNVILYLALTRNWYRAYFETYLTKSTNYETNTCQYAATLIDQNVPEGSTIYMPDEMCFDLISILYNPDQFHFVSITTDEPKKIFGGRSYLILFNSQRHSYFAGDLQKKAEQIVAERKSELISEPSSTQPVLYLIN